MSPSFNDQIVDILLLIRANDPDRIKEILQSRKQPNLSGEETQENLDHLRLYVKYLLLDLEASHREIAELKENLGCDPNA